MPPVPGREGRIGPFVIERELGRGGMGVVYFATQLGLNRPVALKVLASELAGNPEFVERFHREAAALASVDSPHIIAIYDHGTADGTLYLATQYVTGGDLREYLRQRGALPAAVALTIFAQLLEGLRDAHAQGIIHRDIKPGNILLRGDRVDPYVYLADFGIAQSDTESGQTRTGVVAGSLSYLAPERQVGLPATVQSDLYAAGCVLWAMLTGTTPYSGTEFQQMLGHVNGPTPQLPGSAPDVVEINRLLAWSLAKDPAQRPRTAQELLTATLEIAHGRAEPGRTQLRPAPAPDQTRLRPPPSPAPATGGGASAGLITSLPPSISGEHQDAAWGGAAATPLRPPAVPPPPAPPSRPAWVLPVSLVATAVIAVAIVGAAIFWPRSDAGAASGSTPAAPRSVTPTSPPARTKTPTAPASQDPPETEPADPGTAEPSAVLLTEDFSSGALPEGWVPELGNWKIVDGRLQATTGEARARISFGPRSPENFRIDALVRFVKVENAARWLNIGIDYHVAEDWGAVIVARSNTTAPNGVELAQRRRGKAEKFRSDPVQGAPGAIGVGEDHWLSVEVRGRSATVFLNGDPVLQADNLRRTDGGFGFVINRSTVQFDDVTITDLDG